MACKSRPPADVVSHLLSACPGAASLPDSFGWLPLHYACANEASLGVLGLVASAYPGGSTSVDKRRRTPLHFALGHTDRPAEAEAVRLLGGTGAALMADENGMLPLHYACAYGATEQALRVLTDGNIRTITAVDNRGRTPLHFALGNADRPASPGVVSILLSQDRSVVNAIDLESNLPIHLLRTCALAINAEEKDKIDNCQRCFGLYLDARPRAEGHLLMGIQGLPDWLRDYAVVSPVVQSILNVKIAKRFPTAVILMDIFFYVIVVILFPFAVVESITDRADDIPEGGGGGEWKTQYLTPLYLASAYFFVREVVQMLSLASMGQFNTWVVNFENWLDMLYSFLVMFWSVVMALEAFPLEVFQPAAALSLAVFWIMILSFLRNMNVAFAVFVHGVLYVTKRLAAFLVSLVIILFAFTQIFTTLFQQSDQCTELISFQGFPLNTTTFDTADPVNVDTSESCEPEITFPFCSFIPSFIRVFTMLLGEVKDDDFVGEKLETFFYALFFFSCVIVLASVLIAVVVDSYRVIQDERAALVFWSNRLDFVAEMDVIVSFLPLVWCSHSDQSTDDDTAGELWKKVMYLFDDDFDDHGILSIEFIVHNILRFFTACLVIPLWMIIGLCSFGLLWPPQVREYLLTSQMSGRSEIATEEWTRMNKVSKMNEDVSNFREEMMADMDKARLELHIIRTVLDNTKSDIHEEMGNVKEIVTELFGILAGA